MNVQTLREIHATSHIATYRVNLKNRLAVSHFRAERRVAEFCTILAQMEGGREGPRYQTNSPLAPTAISPGSLARFCGYPPSLPSSVRPSGFLCAFREATRVAAAAAPAPARDGGGRAYFAAAGAAARVLRCPSSPSRRPSVLKDRKGEKFRERDNPLLVLAMSQQSTT